MKLVKWNDTPTARDLFFDDFFKGYEDARVMKPAVDVHEEKDKYVIKADLPGLKQSDIKVEVEDGMLKISGERKTEKEDKNEEKHYHYVERSFGSFTRSFTLPKDADAEKIDAKYDNGELTVNIIKSEAKKPKNIEVH